MEAKDMPKLESPFVREKKDGDYVVIDEINEGYEWVFEDENVKATEKLDGTNVSVLVKDGKILEVWNRKNFIQVFSENKYNHYVIKGILNSLKQGYCRKLSNGQYFGELIGTKIQGNPYNLSNHIWIPFQTYAQRKLYYYSWGKYPKTYESISEWFEEGLFSIFYAKQHNLDYSDPNCRLAEGVVFVHPSGKMAKLRRDMFPWYKSKKHKERE